MQRIILHFLLQFQKLKRHYSNYHFSTRKYKTNRKYILVIHINVKKHHCADTSKIWKLQYASLTTGIGGLFDCKEHFILQRNAGISRNGLQSLGMKTLTGKSIISSRPLLASAILKSRIVKEDGMAYNRYLPLQYGFDLWLICTDLKRKYNWVNIQIRVFWPAKE